MYEDKKTYEKIVHDELILLEWAVGHAIRHGDEGECPRCHSGGVFDVEGLGFNTEGSNSIYYSTVFNGWRCRLCDFRMCA